MAEAILEKYGWPQKIEITFGKHYSNDVSQGYVALKWQSTDVNPKDQIPVLAISSWKKLLLSGTT